MQNQSTKKAGWKERLLRLLTGSSQFLVSAPDLFLEMADESVMVKQAFGRYSDASCGMRCEMTLDTVEDYSSVEESASHVKE